MSNAVVSISKTADCGLEFDQYPQKLIAARADTVAPTPNRRMVVCTVALSFSASNDGCS